MKIKFIFTACFLLVSIFFISCVSNSNVLKGNSWIDIGSFAYGSDPNQYIEITSPSDKKSVNVIFYVHGYGNRMIDLTFLEKYRDEFVIGKLDYRYLTPERHELTMDELLMDVHNGLLTLKNVVEAKNITINKVIMMGNSLGSALALLYSYKMSEIIPIPIAFCVSMSGMLDLTDAMYIKIFSRPAGAMAKNYILSLISILSEEKITAKDITKLGFPDHINENVKKISVVNYVNSSVPPTIILHDINDSIIPFSNSLSLYYSLSAYKVPNIFIQSAVKTGHMLGHDISSRRADVFAPYNSRSSQVKLRRYARIINPVLEKKLIEAIDIFINMYCNDVSYTES